jgi:hypothetical protein
MYDCEYSASYFEGIVPLVIFITSVRWRAYMAAKMIVAPSNMDGPPFTDGQPVSDVDVNNHGGQCDG